MTGETNQKLYAILEYHDSLKGDVKEYYFSENPNGEDVKPIQDAEADAEAIVASNELGSITPSLRTVTGTVQTRTYNWSFYHYNDLTATMSSTVEATRKSTTSTWNNKTASVWDIKEYSNVSGRNVTYLDKYLATRLSVQDYANEKITSYSPQSTTTGNISLTLSGGGVPSIGWSESIGSRRILDSSDLANNYARWTLKTPVLGDFSNTLYFSAGTRVYNTVGNFCLQLSQQLNVGTGDHLTGVLTMAYADR